MRDKTPAKPFAKRKAPAPKHHHHSHGIRPGVFYGAVAILLFTNVLTLVGLAMAPDIARLFNGEASSVNAAYEDRIAQLRLDVDRLHSRQYAQAGDINLQLQELAQQQEVLSEQHEYVKQLAGKAAELGIDTPAPIAPPTGDAAMITGSIGAPLDAGAEVAAAAGRIQGMMSESRLALAALSEEATGKTDAILEALADIGIKPKMPDPDETDIGGPLLPPVDGADNDSIIDDANAVMTALDRFKAARGAAELAPVYKPVNSTRISSTFGNRRDPFTGRLAFHSGLDFAAPQGTTVVAAGAGKVSFVGQINGYGNVVEITHAGGLITRYGHLSAFLVKEGDVVDTGDPIARVGSTGRSTGPHLHFEVRRADTAVDPARYLAVGRILTKLLT